MGCVRYVLFEMFFEGSSCLANVIFSTVVGNLVKYWDINYCWRVFKELKMVSILFLAIILDIISVVPWIYKREMRVRGGEENDELFDFGLRFERKGLLI
jgi:hypothetical protein